jgi:signal transduction histidine kinase
VTTRCTAAPSTDGRGRRIPLRRIVLNRIPATMPNRLGIRRQAALAAAVVVALALLAGGALLLFLLQQRLLDALGDTMEARAAVIATALDADGLDDAGELVERMESREQVVQILGPDGDVLAASEEDVADEAITDLLLGEEDMARRIVDLNGALDGRYVVAGEGVEEDEVEYTVLVAASAELQAATVRTVGLYLLVAAPLLVALVVLMVWFLVGRSLTAVEAIRTRVASIGPAELDRRVDVPPTQDEIAQLAETMNAMLARLQAADVRLRRFVSDASHELRTPLAAAKTSLEVAARDPGGWPQSRGLVLAELERMSHLVENLLLLARVDDQAAFVRFADVDLDDVVDGELRRLAPAPSPALSPVIEARLEPVRLRGDAGRLAQLVRNLLDNARRHAASRIRVSTGQDGGRARLVIDNDGDTIPAADRTRIFERFVRLDEARTRDTGGSGLGLAIVAEIAKAHGGTVRAGSSPEGWTRFTVDLPLSR